MSSVFGIGIRWKKYITVAIYNILQCTSIHLSTYNTYNCTKIALFCTSCYSLAVKSLMKLLYYVSRT